MKPIRMAVVGAGHLGRIHARLVQTLEDAQLVAIAEPALLARELAADRWDVPVLPHHAQLMGRIDAAVVATPTRFHHGVALDLLRHGVHVLVEKPITATVGQADQLIRAADRHRCVLQVGHVERFNPAFQVAATHLGPPRYIQAIRTSGYTGRSIDVGVVHDLMIHDLDLILHLVRGTVTRVQALGVSVLGDHEDMAQARLEFDNGCVVNLTASRTSIEGQRCMQVFCDDAFVAVDFAERTVKVVRPDSRLVQRELCVDQLSEDERQSLCTDLFDRWLPVTSPRVPECNPLQEELQEFVRCIRTGQTPQVGGPEARAALQVAGEVLDRIDHHRWNGTDTGPVGPLARPVPVILPGPPWQQRAAGDGRPDRKAG